MPGERLIGGEVMKKIALLMVLLFMLAGCSAPGAEPGAAESTPEPTPEPSPTLDLNDPLLQEAQAYAEAEGIELEEALARLDAQQALSESGLQEALMENEAETFAGLGWRKSPPSGMVWLSLKMGSRRWRPIWRRSPMPTW